MKFKTMEERKEGVSKLNLYDKTALSIGYTILPTLIVSAAAWAIEKGVKIYRARETRKVQEKERGPVIDIKVEPKDEDEK